MLLPVKRMSVSDLEFAELYRKHRGQVEKQLRNDVSSASAAHIEDLTQEVFIKVHRDLPNFRGESAFETWLYTVVERTAIDFGRKRSSRIDPLFYDEEEFTEELPPVGHDDLEEQGLEIVLSAMFKLPERQAEALRLQVWEEATDDQIAAALDCTPRAASDLLYRARQTLREQFGGEGRAIDRILNLPWYERHAKKQSEQDRIARSCRDHYGRFDVVDPESRDRIAAQHALDRLGWLNHASPATPSYAFKSTPPPSVRTNAPISSLGSPESREIFDFRTPKPNEGSKVSAETRKTQHLRLSMDVPELM